MPLLSMTKRLLAITWYLPEYKKHDTCNPELECWLEGLLKPFCILAMTTLPPNMDQVAL